MTKKIKQGLRPKKRKRLAGKRTIKVNKKLQQDFLSKLRDKLEEEHIKRYTFIVKGSKMYTAGIFWSEKNKKKYVFRSTYEFAFFYSLENDPLVLEYIVEPFEIPYIDPRYKGHKIYKPDVIVSYSNGKTKLLEIKPKQKLHHIDVRAKAEGARNFLKIHMPHVSYEFVTEEHIFKEPGDYERLLGEIDPVKLQKREARKEKREVRAAAKAASPLVATKGKFTLAKPGDFAGFKKMNELAYFKSKLPKTMRNDPIAVI